MFFAELLTRALERRFDERRLFERRREVMAPALPERRVGPRRAGDRRG